MKKRKLTHSADSNDPTQPSEVEPEEAAGIFRYTPFQRDNEIRLVKLLPTSFYEPIACRLFHAPLDSTDHPYEALSYTWGCAEDQVLIQANGKSLSVTHNLSTALRYLRKDYERTLWIDAICINQEDENEKTGQVALMTKIYRSADQVIVWLGPPRDNSDLIMSFFDRAAKETDTSTETIFGKRIEFSLQRIEAMSPGKSAIPKQLLSDLMKEDQNRLRRALEALLEREYWYRAWVIQEILVAKKIVLVCGTHSVPWDSATAIVEWFVIERSKRVHGKNTTERILSDLQAMSYMRIRQETGGGVPMGVSISETTRQMSRHSLQTLYHLALCRLSPEHEKGPRWLLGMLIAFRQFKSKDRRDKIFSLLGLINRELFRSESSTALPLDVDYSLDFFTVSTKLFQYYISAPSQNCGVATPESKVLYRGTLNILCASQPTESSEFPSWLADFSRDNGMEPWPMLDYQCLNFQYCGPSFSPDHSIIYVPGVSVTKVEIGCVSGEDDDVIATDELCLLRRIKVFMQLAADQDLSIPTSLSFWDALMLEVSVEWKFEKSQILEYLSAYFMQEELDPKPPELLLKALEDGLADQEQYVLGFLDTFRRKSFRRRFAIFHVQGERYSAMVPAASKPGDTLCLLWGCECPVLLREKSDRQSTFEFIGPCFIPDWEVQQTPGKYGPIKTIELH